MDVKYLISAAAGGVLGFVGGYLLCKRRSEDYIHQQIKEARQHLNAVTDDVLKQFEKNPRVEESEKEPEDEPDHGKYPYHEVKHTPNESLGDYLNRIHAEGYVEPETMEDTLPDNYVNSRGENKREEMERRTNAKPYRITKEEFGQPDDHELVAFTLYADGTLCDDADEPIENSELSIGCTVAELIDMFHIEEEVTLYFRNERTQLEIEITEDARNYADILEDKPYLKT